MWRFRSILHSNLFSHRAHELWIWLHPILILRHSSRVTFNLRFMGAKHFRVRRGDRFVATRVGSGMHISMDAEASMMSVDDARRSLGASFILAAVCGCSGTAGTSPSAGGSSSNGGSPSGGVTSAGSAAVGGTSSVGGAATAGGTIGAGGVVSTGGAQATGGRGAASTSTGGTSNSSGCGNTNLPAACNTTTTGMCTISVGGIDRQYFVVLPSNYNANTAYPIVFLWHGLNGTASQLIGGGFMAYYGVRTGFPNAIYVAAQGLPSGMNDSGTDYGWPNTNGRDINFLKAMLAGLESNYCVDQNRIFSTGMSYGGMMSDTIGCQMPDVFRALGVMSGSLFTGYGQTCVNHPIAAFITHGTADTTVDISGDETARDQFIKDNGCDTTNTQSIVLDANTTCTLYNVCSAGNYPVEWCPVNGEGHTIPSWAGTQIAQFFLQF